MIIRLEQPSHRYLAISQPAHSWVSGQFARAWGNEVFSTFHPYEQVCYAAEEHDVGFLRWESAPTLNEATGLPHTFEDLPQEVHFEIWRTGITQLRPVCPYASLIVSLHFCNLCERFHSRLPEQDRSASGAFLKEQRDYQKAIRGSLQSDPLLQEALGDDFLAYHRDLIAIWDLFSLELCRDRVQEFKLPRVPRWKSEPVDILVRKSDRLENFWEVDPWPFAGTSMTTICEGKMIDRRFKDLDAMRTAVLNAERMSLEFNFGRGKLRVNG